MTTAELLTLAAFLLACIGETVILRRAGVLDLPGLFTPWRSQRRAPRLGRDVRTLPASIWFVAAAVVFLSQPLGVSLGANLPSDWIGPQGSDKFRAAIGAAGFGLGAVVAVFMLYLIDPRLSPAAGTRLAWRDLPLGLLAAALIAPFYLATAIGTEWFVRAVLHQQLPDVAHEALVKFITAPLSATGLTIALTAVLLVPVVEECIYRVFLTSSLACLLSGRPAGAGSTPPTVATWSSILITSAIFACIHALQGGPVPWAAVPGLFVLALGLGLAYERTRRLGVPITIHALFNLTNLLIAAATKS